MTFRRWITKPSRYYGTTLDRAPRKHLLQGGAMACGRDTLSMVGTPEINDVNCVNCLRVHERELDRNVQA